MEWSATFGWRFIFFVLLCVVGMMEGMQIADFALSKMLEKELKKVSAA